MGHQTGRAASDVGTRSELMDEAPSDGRNKTRIWIRSSFLERTDRVTRKNTRDFFCAEFGASRACMQELHLASRDEMDTPEAVQRRLRAASQSIMRADSLRDRSDELERTMQQIERHLLQSPMPPVISVADSSAAAVIGTSVDVRARAERENETNMRLGGGDEDDAIIARISRRLSSSPAAGATSLHERQSTTASSQWEVMEATLLGELREADDRVAVLNAQLAWAHDRIAAATEREVGLRQRLALLYDREDRLSRASSSTGGTPPAALPAGSEAPPRQLLHHHRRQLSGSRPDACRCVGSFNDAAAFAASSFSPIVPAPIPSNVAPPRQAATTGVAAALAFAPSAAATTRPADPPLSNRSGASTPTWLRLASLEMEAHLEPAPPPLSPIPPSPASLSGSPEHHASPCAAGAHSWPCTPDRAAEPSTPATAAESGEGLGSGLGAPCSPPPQPSPKIKRPAAARAAAARALGMPSTVLVAGHSVAARSASALPVPPAPAVSAAVSAAAPGISMPSPPLTSPPQPAARVARPAASPAVKEAASCASSSSCQ